jgi:hypothetical protein
VGFKSTIPDTGGWPTGKGNGLCRGCLRDLFTQGTPDSPYCIACQRTVKTGGRPLYMIPNGRSEVLPQERPIDDTTWRTLADCGETDDPRFEPVPMLNGQLPPMIRDAALAYCAECPVLDACMSEADDHEYLGLWGGSYRYYTHATSYGQRTMYGVRDLLADPGPDGYPPPEFRELIRRREQPQGGQAGDATTDSTTDSTTVEAGRGTEEAAA